MIYAKRIPPKGLCEFEGISLVAVDKQSIEMKGDLGFLDLKRKIETILLFGKYMR